MKLENKLSQVGVGGWTTLDLDEAEFMTTLLFDQGELTWSVQFDQLYLVNLILSALLDQLDEMHFFLTLFDKIYFKRCWQSIWQALQGVSHSKIQFEIDWTPNL